MHEYEISIIVFALLLIAVITASAGYSMWYDSLKANIYIHIRKPYLEIGSWKVFAANEYVCKGVNDVVLSTDNRSLMIHVDNASTVWVGLVVENNDVVTATLRNINVSIATHEGVVNPVIQIYVYPPVKTGIGNKPYWGEIKCSNLPVPGYIGNSLNIDVEAGFKLVSWIEIMTGNIVSYTANISIN
ncbi:MAG: hypothetical protein ACP5N5_06955 [Desulfurococcus sp.]|uniref:hypothetical protein n=1 Tax=Desulfurococcus sp. TaxID=51678 RepID=UPI003D0C2BC4